MDSAMVSMILLLLILLLLLLPMLTFDAEAAFVFAVVVDGC